LEEAVAIVRSEIEEPLGSVLLILRPWCKINCLSLVQRVNPSLPRVPDCGYPALLRTARRHSDFIRSSFFMAIPATQLRPGMVIKHNNDLHSVFSVEHRTPGNLRAFIQAKLRNLRTGAMFEHRFRSADAIEKITVDEVNMEYLYNDGDGYYFMNTENYEQTHLTREILGDAVDYLTPNLNIKIEFFDGKAVGVELPQTVELTVVETEPGLRSATASSVTKPAKTETGLVVQVPPFINEGERIKVDTSEGAYLSRA
jgi:elongation factor P